jgi:hypothetical protein
MLCDQHKPCHDSTIILFNKPAKNTSPFRALLGSEKMKDGKIPVLLIS